MTCHSERLSSFRSIIEIALRSCCPAVDTPPAILHQAMAHSLFAPGKRLRPVLCLAACEACGGDPATALPAACAIECIHTYSLVHDDLPCMDDDDMRRGLPTVHKVFGEGMAVLAGDALLTLAFEILASTPPPPGRTTADLVRELGRAAGSLFLIGGQAADLEGENRTATAADVDFIHRGKTAAMVAVSLRLGAMSAGAPATRCDGLESFGRDLGLAFQIIDDILDVTQTSEVLGKSAGKDQQAGKSTYPAVHGLEPSRQAARALTDRALAALEPLGERGEFLGWLACDLLKREF